MSLLPHTVHTLAMPVHWQLMYTSFSHQQVCVLRVDGVLFFWSQPWIQLSMAFIFAKTNATINPEQERVFPAHYAMCQVVFSTKWSQSICIYSGKCTTQLFGLHVSLCGTERQTQVKFLWYSISASTIQFSCQYYMPLSCIHKHENITYLSLKDWKSYYTEVKLLSIIQQFFFVEPIYLPVCTFKWWFYIVRYKVVHGLVEMPRLLFICQK